MNYHTNELRNWILNGTELIKLLKLNSFIDFCESINFIINLLDELCIITLNYNNIEYFNLYNYFFEYLKE